MTPSTRLLSTAIAVACLSLAACGKRDDSQTAGQKLDGAIASAQQKADTAKAEMQQGAAEVKSEVKQGVAELKAGASNAAEKVAGNMEDAAITLSVNAELTKDPTLSALRINVDTVNGAVSLKGSAPSKAARERATQLAASVKGVTRVDNQLEVRG